MRNSSLQILSFVTLLFHSGDALGAVVFVDQTLSTNCLSGSYSAVHRDCSGTEGDAFTTIEGALEAMNSGDDMLLRGGTYEVLSPLLTTCDGTPDDYSSMRSYPGEWAVLDGQRMISTIIGDWDEVWKYWEIAHLEIRGAYGNGGVQGIAGQNGPFHFHHLYVHDNVSTRSNDNPGGIYIQKPQNCIIEYCYIANNGGENVYNENTANIVFFSDYDMPGDVVIEHARYGNVVRFNLVEGSGTGFKAKGMQALSIPEVYPINWMYQDLGDDIHHNIFLEYRDRNRFDQDFCQVHHNIFATTTGRLIQMGGEYTYSRRGNYGSCFYNNTIIGHSRPVQPFPNVSDPDPERIWLPTAENPIRMYTFFANNIMYDLGGPIDLRLDTSFYFSYGDRHAGNEIDFSVDTAENNLYTPRTSSEDIINVGSDTYSASEFVSAGLSSVVYTQSASTDLMVSGSSYQTNGSFAVDSSHTIADGGLGGSHPYLEGVTIPSYVGATDPEDNAWVDIVLGLATIDNLVDSGGSSSDETVSITALDAEADEETGDSAIVRLSRTSADGNLSVNLTLSGTAGRADYSCTPSCEGITMPTGETSLDLTITPLADETYEGTESLVIRVASGYGYLIGTPAEAVVEIHEEDRTFFGSGVIFGANACADVPGTIEDTYNNAGEPEINYANDPSLRTYSWNGSANNIIITVDLSTVPAGIEISSAKLFLYLYDMEETGGDDLSWLTVHPIAGPGAPVVTEVTWQEYRTGQSWTNDNGGLDDITASSDAVAVSKTYGWFSFDVTDIISDWMSGANPSYGLLIASDQEGNTNGNDTNRLFYSSEAESSALRPVLIVNSQDLSGVDSGPDGGLDGGSDGGSDGGLDGGSDGGLDGGIDSGPGEESGCACGHSPHPGRVPGVAIFLLGAAALLRNGRGQ